MHNLAYKVQDLSNFSSVRLALLCISLGTHQKTSENYSTCPVYDIFYCEFLLYLQGFLQYGVPSSPEKLLTLMNKVLSTETTKIIGILLTC